MIYFRRRLIISLSVILLLTGFLYWNFRLKQVPLFLFFQKPVHYDLLVKNGTIVDGSGSKPFPGDVAINGDRIARVGRFRATADQIVDAEGMVVSPGYINPHSHIDQIIFQDPGVPSSLLQGVTTEIVGMDGQSPIHLEDFYSEVSKLGTGVNLGSFIGQGSVRQAVMGSSQRPANPQEISQMQELVKKAMEQGAFGLSTGLEYAPGVYTPTNEIIQLAKTVSPYKGLYVSHIRDEGDNVVAAVKEALEIGKQAKVTTIISHIKVGSSVNDLSREDVITRHTEEIIKAVSNQQKSGNKVYADVYPYRVSFFLINRRPNEVLWRYPYETIFVSAGSNTSYLGKTISQIAALENVSPGVVAQRLAADPNARVTVNNLSEASLRRLIRADFTMISMDNVTYWPDPSYTPPPHPRNWGTYPKILGYYVRQKVLTLEEAVHKMTGMTASVYGIPKRGFIRKGFFADLVVFDPDSIRDRATYWEPTLPPEGIYHVIVNGKPAVTKGPNPLAGTRANHLTGIRSGRIIKPGKILREHP